MPLLIAYGKNGFSHDVAHIMCVRTAKVLVSLHECPDSPEHWLLACVISTLFSMGWLI